MTSVVGQQRVLIVDDDQRLLLALGRALSLKGFEVVTARNAGEALRLLDDQPPDIIVLDVMMPVVDGLQLCRLIQSRLNLPILMLTALDSVDDRIAGLEAGADDYLAKPFATDELAARLRTLLRRSRPHVPPEMRLHYADLTLDISLWRVERNGRALALTSKEFRILEVLLRTPERVLSREEIMTAVWHDEGLIESNVVDVHMASLRQKLEAGGETRLIQTIRGVGYALRE